MILYGALLGYLKQMSFYPYRQQVISQEGDLVRVQNVRNFHYYSAADFEEEYYDKTYDLNDLVGVNYVIAGFERPFNLLFAHVLVTFEFKNNVFVSVSPEAGRAMNDWFSFYRCFTKSYPLIYVIADEYDVLRSRTNVFRYDTYMYPIDLTTTQTKALFSSIVDRVNALRTRPEKYHLIKNSCISELYRHFNNVLGEAHIPAGLGTIFPAWLDLFAHRRRFFAAKCKWWSLRYKHRINELGAVFNARDEYSVGIRRRSETPDDRC